MKQSNLLLGWLLLTLAGCGSNDDRAISTMLKERFPGLEVVNESDPIEYRSRDDARLACVTFNLRNQWGEDSPLQRVIAWYIPANGTWHTDNPVEVGDDVKRHCEAFIARNQKGAPVVEKGKVGDPAPPLNVQPVSKIDSGTGVLPPDSFKADSSSSASFTADERSLMRAADDAWAAFRNGDDLAERRQTVALDALYKRGICWGKIDQAQAEYDFHRCDGNSIQNQLAQ